MGNAPRRRPEPERVVLVPPVFERTRDVRDRFTQSPFEYLFAKRELDRLGTLLDFGGIRVDLALRPEAFGGDGAGAGAEEEEVTVRASLDLPARGDRPVGGLLDFRWENVVANAEDPMGFLDLRVQVNRPEDANQGVFRGCGALLHPRYRTALFAILDREAPPCVGAKYNSPDASIGLRVHPTLSFGTKTLAPAVGPAPATVWAVARRDRLYAGFQVDVSGLSVILDHQAACSFRIGTPTSSDSAAEAVLRLCDRGRTFRAGYYQHLVVRRRIWNLFAPAHHVGITNYVDVGFEVVVRDFQDKNPAVSLLSAIQWQLNRNWLMKLVASDKSLGFALSFKAWGIPSLAVCASASLDLPSRVPRVGLTFAVENFGDVTYQKSQPRSRIDSRWERGPTAEETAQETRRLQMATGEAEVRERRSEKQQRANSEHRFL